MKAAKAARLQAYGEPNGIHVESVPLRDPQAGELRIRVHAAGVNPIDLKIRAGYFQKMSPQLPFTLGGDFSGVVEAVGSDVENFKVGDEVYGQASETFHRGTGTFAEYVIVPAASISIKPRMLSHTEAAALPLAGVSALHGMTEYLKLSAGQKVLIHGGAGGIGSIAIQLAKHLGAYVATTVSADDIEYVRGLGVDQVIDHKKQQFEDILRDYDAVFDNVGGETYARSFKVLKKGGRMVSMVEQVRKDLMEQFGVEAFWEFTQMTGDRLAELARLVNLGALNVHVERTFPLERTAAALAALEKESPRGKVVVEVA